MSVRAMKAGAVEFLTKPFRDQELCWTPFNSPSNATAADVQKRRRRRQAQSELRHPDAAREQEIMSLVTAGLMNKQIAGELGVSEITVKVHRGSVMRKMGAKSLAELVRMADALGLRRSTP